MARWWTRPSFTGRRGATVMAEAGSPVTHEQFVYSFGKRNDLNPVGLAGRGCRSRAHAPAQRGEGVALRALVRAHGIEPLRACAGGWRGSTRRLLQAIATSAQG